MSAGTFVTAGGRIAGRIAGRVVALATAATLLLVGTATTASAHTELESATPADAATVAEAPAEVALVFSQSLLGVTSVTVTGPDGATVSQQPPTHDGPRVFQALGPLTSNGAYTTDYVVVAGDGHELTGTVGFSFTGAAPLDPAGSAPSAVTAALSGTTASNAAAPATENEADTGSDDAGSDDGSRDVGSVVIGAVLVLLVLVALFFGVRRLRRRG